MNTTPFQNSVNRNSALIILMLLACFAVFQKTEAVSPAPDGGYPNFTTAEGQKALFSLTTGVGNTAVGWFSLFSNADTSFNTATGAGALLFNTADENTAVGAAALLFNTTGFNNTAIGAAALLNNVGGARNNAVGSSALNENVTGPLNNAHGSGALFSNTSSCCNNAFGDDALSNSTGFGNTAIGDLAGIGVTTHNNIIAIGAGVSGVDTALGEVDNSCYIGNISGASVDAGAFNFVLVDADGKLGTVAVDANGNKMAVSTPQGVQPQAMLRKVEEQAASIAALKATVAQQQKGMEILTAQLKEEAAQIQKVSAQLEASKPAPQVVNNP